MIILDKTNKKLLIIKIINKTTVAKIIKISNNIYYNNKHS